MSPQEIQALVEHVGVAGIVIWMYVQLLARYDKLLDHILTLNQQLEALQQSIDRRANPSATEGPQA